MLWLRDGDNYDGDVHGRLGAQVKFNQNWGINADVKVANGGDPVDGRPAHHLVNKPAPVRRRDDARRPSAGIAGRRPSAIPPIRTPHCRAFFFLRGSASIAPANANAFQHRRRRSRCAARGRNWQDHRLSLARRQCATIRCGNASDWVFVALAVDRQQRATHPRQRCVQVPPANAGVTARPRSMPPAPSAPCRRASSSRSKRSGSANAGLRRAYVVQRARLDERLRGFADHGQAGRRHPRRCTAPCRHRRWGTEQQAFDTERGARTGVAPLSSSMNSGPGIAARGAGLAGRSRS